jgi:hypothetical protein
VMMPLTLSKTEMAVSLKAKACTGVKDYKT